MEHVPIHRLHGIPTDLVIEAARRGENPTGSCRMASGWAVLGDWQLLPGYCVLLADPQVPDLNSLGTEARDSFLRDITRVGDAILQITDAERINYSIFGNSDPILHAHICPRYAWEEPSLRKGPTAHYDRSKGPSFDLERGAGMMRQIRDAIHQ